jgi:hypothetical protein
MEHRTLWNVGRQRESKRQLSIQIIFPRHSGAPKSGRLVTGRAILSSHVSQIQSRKLPCNYQKRPGRGAVAGPDRPRVFGPDRVADRLGSIFGTEQPCGQDASAAPLVGHA